MSGFLDRIFGSKIEIDLIRSEFESRLSFEHSKLDQALLRAYVGSGKIDTLGEYLRKTLELEEGTKILVSYEMELLREYIDLVRNIRGQDFFVQFNTKIDQAEEEYIEPFVLFPLVQNALKNAYASMEKYPIKIRISASAGGVLLEVSNRVNHYVANQGEDELIQHYKQRLSLVYPGKHELFLNSNSNTFKATLFLKY